MENIDVDDDIDSTSISSMTIKYLKKELENYIFQMKQLEQRIKDIECAINNLK
jgi:hypothetical protein